MLRACLVCEGLPVFGVDTLLDWGSACALMQGVILVDVCECSLSSVLGLFKVSLLDSDFGSNTREFCSGAFASLGRALRCVGWDLFSTDSSTLVLSCADWSFLINS